MCKSFRLAERRNFLVEGTVAVTPSMHCFDNVLAASLIEIESISPPLETRLACDFLWAIEFGRSDPMPFPNLRVKKSGIHHSFVVSEP